jgi:hypothetical protein
MKKQLSTKRVTKLLKHENNNSNIVIGAPHHAVGGITKLPCSTHEDSDENTGFIAWEISKLLKTHSVIECYAKVDPNKKLDTDYSKQIIRWKPKYLIEIHGHGGKNAGKHELQISSGSSERNKYSIKFAGLLQKIFSANKELGKYSVNGDFNSIYFQAKGTATITDERWISFHIELPPSLRINDKKELPNIAQKLINAIANTIKMVCI